jgi:hypothetical protein
MTPWLIIIYFIKLVQKRFQLDNMSRQIKNYDYSNNKKTEVKRGRTLLQPSERLNCTQQEEQLLFDYVAYYADKNSFVSSNA